MQSQPAFASIPTFQRQFQVISPPLQIQNRPLPNRFPLLTKTTAGDFGQMVGKTRRCGKKGKSLSMIVGNFGYFGSKLVSRKIDKSLWAIKDLVYELNFSFKMKSTTCSSLQYH
jgi:hypothetical protein